MVYVLELKNEKYYVGYAVDARKRIREHFRGEGSKWTQLYKPIRVLEIVEDASLKEECEITIKYMLEYGWENVRGGAWCQIEREFPPLPLWQPIGYLQAMMWDCDYSPDPPGEGGLKSVAPARSAPTGVNAFSGE